MSLHAIINLFTTMSFQLKIWTPISKMGRFGLAKIWMLHPTRMAKEKLTIRMEKPQDQVRVFKVDFFHILISQ